jgi:ketosteroid isomerase-like protein
LLFLTAAITGYAQQQNKGLQDQIVAQERAEIEAVKMGDMAAFANFLAEDVVLVDSHGPAGKAEVLQHTADFHLRDYTMSDVKFIAISPDSGLIVYRLAESGTSHGKDFSVNVHVSALWAKRSGKWVCVYGQETAAK